MTIETERITPNGGPERRRHPRCPIAGLAILTRPPHVGTTTCEVRNLSASGAMLLDCPPMSAGERCRLALVAPPLLSKTLKARIVRNGVTSTKANWAAVEFVDVPIELEQLLAKVVQVEIARATMPSVLVVDTDRWMLAQIAELFEQHGRRVLLALSCTKALEWVECCDEQVALVLAGASLDNGDLQTLLDHIGDHHHNIHRAAFSQLLSEQAVGRMLDMLDTEPAGHAPWTPDTLG